jgi:hypothetical protein
MAVEAQQNTLRTEQIYISTTKLRGSLAQSNLQIPVLSLNIVQC